MGVSFVFAAAALAVVVAELCDHRTPISYLANGDFLSVAVVYQDVLSGYPLKANHFSAAMYTFPEFFLYALIKPFIADTMTAVLTWEGALFILEVLAAAVAGWSLCGRDGRRYV